MKQRPNILMLVEDHQAFYGHRNVQTPYFDKLKKRGVFFENTYCSTPLCMPSRKSMMTGLYPQQHGQTDNSFETNYDNLQTYIDVLQKQGYTSYYFGKWHGGSGTPEDLGCLGVSYPDYSNPYKQKEYQEYIHRKGIPAAAMEVEVNMCEKGWIDDVEEGTLYTFSRPLLNEALCGSLAGPKESHEVFYVADLACRQLERLQAQKPEEPFMMRVDFWGPHQPYYPAKEYIAMYPPEDIKEYPSFCDDLKEKPESYRFDTGRETSRNRELQIPNPVSWEIWSKLLSRCYAQITMTDEAAGRIIEKLEELRLDKNTVIIWTADHGDALGCHGGHFDKAFYLPEEVLRIPLVISYPGVLPEGLVCEKLISNVDFAPTIANIAGADMDSVQGKNILDLFTQEIPEWREAVVSQTFGHLAPWRAKAVRWEHYKYVWNQGDIEELYDLEADPYEMVNLAKKSSYLDILQKMRKNLREQEREIGW